MIDRGRPRRSPRSAARDDRRRDGEGLRRRGLLRAARGEARARQGRLSPRGRHRRREPLRRRTATRSTVKRASRGNSVYFPRRVIPMLPGAAVQRPVLAQPAGRAARDGLRHDASRRTARSRSYKFYPAVMRSHARLTYTIAADMLEHPQARRREPPPRPPAAYRDLYRLFRVLVESRARERGAIDFETIETQIVFDDERQDRAHRAGAAQRRAPRDRGMHARGQRLRLRLPAQAQAADALPHPRGTDAREARGAARVPEGLRAGLTGGDTPHAKDYAKLLARVKNRAGRAAPADGDAALAPAGRIQPGQRRPFRARLRVLHAFHLADPPLSRTCSCTARSRRCSTRKPLRAGRLARAGCALLDDRAARRRGDARRRELAEVLLHAATGSGETFTGSISGGHGLRRVRRARRRCTSKACCTFPSSATDYFHFDGDQAPARWASARTSAIGWATGCA